VPRPNVEAERRDQILRATWQVISGTGFRSLRLSDVARAAGVSAGMIHYYFAGKDELVREAFARYYDHSMQRRQHLLETGVEPLILLKRIGESYLPIDPETTEGWRVWGELWVEGLHSPELADLNEDYYGKWRQLLAGIIRDGQAQGTIRSGDAVTFANMLASMLDGMAIQVMLGSRSMTAERMRRTFTAYLDDMLATSPGNTSGSRRR
jgi:AcrR family transcriptional regulator